MRVRSIVCAAALGFAFLGACQQGSGDVCEVDRDCDSPLLCNESTGRCQLPGTGGTADAAVVFDAAELVDAEPPDAGLPDAEVPDAGELDADLPDAAEPG